jgi:Ca2+-transporting ATPase
MNQMTAVEVIDPTDRYAITGTGYSLEGKISHPAGKTDTIEAAILPYVIASDANLVDGKVVGDPTEGALLVLAYKASMYIDETRERLPRLATLPFDPSYKRWPPSIRPKDAAGNGVVRCFVKGRAGGHEPRRDSPFRRREHPLGRHDQAARPAARRAHGAAGPAGHGRCVSRSGCR